MSRNIWVPLWIGFGMNVAQLPLIGGQNGSDPVIKTAKHTTESSTVQSTAGPATPDISQRLGDLRNVLPGGMNLRLLIAIFTNRRHSEFKPVSGAFVFFQTISLELCSCKAEMCLFWNY